MPGATTTKRPLPSPTAPSRAAAGALCLATTARAARTPLVALFEDFFVARKPIKGSPHTEAAYRRDLLGVLAHLTTELGTETTKLRLGQLSAKALRRAFASFSEGHAASSIARAWTAWDQFFAFLVAEDVVIGNPMAAVAKPKVPRREPKALQGEGTPERLLTSLSTGEHQGRGSWPERDLAFVATALLTGLRLSELLGLDSGSLDGRKGERRLRVLGKGSKVRFVPLKAPLEVVLAKYLRSRKARFPAEKVGPASPLFVDRHGERLQRGGAQYLVKTAYRSADIGRAACPRAPSCTPCATPWPPAWPKTVPAPARSSTCWDMRAWRRRSSTSTRPPTNNGQQRANRTYRVLEQINGTAEGRRG